MPCDARVRARSPGHEKRSIIDREHFRPGRTVDDLFRECLALVIDGATAKSGLTP
jgi:hypothetical protein